MLGFEIFIKIYRFFQHSRSYIYYLALLRKQLQQNQYSAIIRVNQATELLFHKCQTYYN